MAEILRRFLWLLPVLSIGAVLVFLAIGSLSPMRATLALPLLYNEHPTSAKSEALEALALTQQDNPRGAALFQILGGAALPTVFEKWPGLSVKDQRKVAEALWPVRDRMQLMGERRETVPLLKLSRSPSDAPSDEKVLFWKRYRDEHALDLRPLSAARLVKRMTSRESKMQSADLLALDTYVLPTLMEHLGSIKSKQDVDRARRIASHVSRMTDQEFFIPDTSDEDDALKVVTEMRTFWDKNGAKWTSLGRFELLVARFSQTEFAGWLSRTFREIAGKDHRGSLLLVASLMKRSLLPLLGCLSGLLLLGPLVAATFQVAELKARRFRFERIGLRTAMAFGLATLLLLVLTEKIESALEMSLLALLMGTALSTFILHRELSDRLDWRTHHVLSRGRQIERVFAVGRWIVPSIPTMAPLAVAEAALWVTCLESAAHLPGIGSQTLDAVRSGDIDFLMYIALGLGLLTGGLQVLADAMLGTRNLAQGEV